MHVGQAWQQRGITQIDDICCIRSTHAESHFGDAVIDDGNERVASQFALDGVDKVCSFQVKGLCLRGKCNNDEAKRCERLAELVQ